jgi:hypothetical protein
VADARKILRTRPKFLRAGIARGLGPAAAVEPEGGQRGAGLIRGMAVVTRGEALGHGMWLDAEFLEAVRDRMNAARDGMKARFTHPGLSSDGLGKFLGRARDADLEGDVVRADLHFSDAAHEAPDGDLAEYVMRLAVDDPAAFGTSIVYVPDFEAEQAFLLEHGAEIDQWGALDIRHFESPDPENVDNLPHARLKELRAVDVVDDPAANPGGLFHRGDELAREADELVEFALGISDKRPQLVQLDLDPDRVGAFVKRFLDRHDLAVVSKGEAAMPKGKKELADQAAEAAAAQTADEKPADEAVDAPVGDSDAGDADDQAEAAAPAGDAASGGGESQQSAGAPGRKFLEAFGDRGAVWFAEGRTFEEAQVLYNCELAERVEKLSAENAELRAKLAGKRGESTPVSFQAEESDPHEKRRAELEPKLGPGLARFAAGMRFERNGHGGK